MAKRSSQKRASKDTSESRSKYKKKDDDHDKKYKNKNASSVVYFFSHEINQTNKKVSILSNFSLLTSSTLSIEA